MGNMLASNSGPNASRNAPNTGRINVVVRNNAKPVGAVAPKANAASIDVDLIDAEEGEVSDLSLAERGSSPSPPTTAGGGRKSRKNRKSTRKNRKNSRRTTRNRS